MPGLRASGARLEHALVDPATRVSAKPSFVSFHHGIYPDVAAVKDYLQRLWDPASESLAAYVHGVPYSIYCAFRPTAATRCVLHAAGGYKASAPLAEAGL
jgi:hypothetical protein